MKHLLYMILLILTHEERKKRSACLVLNSNTQCQKCNNGYLLVNNRCIAIVHHKRQAQEEPEIDPIARCILPMNNGNCGKCRIQFVLYNNTCVLSTCNKFTGCLFCEYKYCIRCQEGFIMTPSNCQPKASGNNTESKNPEKNFDQMTNNQLVIILGSILTIMIILNFVIITIMIIKCILNKRKKKLINKIKSLPVNMRKKTSVSRIKEDDIIIKRPSNQHDLNMNNVSFNASNDNLIRTSTFIQSKGLDFPSQTIQVSLTKKCIVCDSDKVYVIFNCGCQLCFAHYLEYIKQTSKLKVCNTHKVQLINYYIVQNLSFLNSNDSEILHVNSNNKLCPICKKNTGVISLNCNCNTRLCDKCFKDIIKMVNYYQCPTCQTIVSK